MATPDSDSHRDSVISWLDRMKASSSARNALAAQVGVGVGSANPFTLESRGGGKSTNGDESDDDADHDGNTTTAGQGQGVTVSVESEEETSPGTLVDPETESYPGLPDSAVPLGLLATLSISSSIEKGLGGYGRSKSKSRGGSSVGGGAAGDGGSTRTAGGAVEKQEPDEDDDVVRIVFSSLFLCFLKVVMGLLMGLVHAWNNRASRTIRISCRGRRRIWS